MRNFILLASLVFPVAGSFTACNRESSAADKKPIGTKVQDSLDTTKQKLAEAQQELRTKTDAKMKEFDASIADLRKRAAEATDDSQAKWNEMADSLENKRDALAAKLEDWKSITADKWQSFSADVSRMVDDLQRSTKDALDKAK
jgi:Skp family chaperone for outer membrane proteins